MRLLNDILRNAQETHFHMYDNAIALLYRGSLAHGTFIPNSNPNSIDDQDLLGVVMPPVDWFFGLRNFEQFEKFEGYWDVLIYDLRKFIRLLLKSNPNVLGALFTPEDMFLKLSPEFARLRENRHLFLSKSVYAAFCGYAKGQLHKMQSMAYQGYMGEKRKGLVDKYGYDTKNAQHLIRLQRQGTELLRTGEMLVARPDANELKQIKLGQWSIEKVKEVAEQQSKEMDEAFAATKLPEQPDTQKIEELVQSIQKEYYVRFL